MFTVLTELEPTRYWLVCDGCRRRWSLVPQEQLLPQTRRIMAEHQPCEGPEPAAAADADVQAPPPG